jgi:regulation of enolase protein 1 (concanavalin A-like superfamily)
MVEESVEDIPLPLQLRLSRQGDLLTAEYAVMGQEWQRVGKPLAVPTLAGACPVGIAVLSHQAAGLTEAGFTGINLENLPADGKPPPAAMSRP